MDCNEILLLGARRGISFLHLVTEAGYSPSALIRDPISGRREWRGQLDDPEAIANLTAALERLAPRGVEGSKLSTEKRLTEIERRLSALENGDSK
jgi:hypothetical protein